MIESHERFDVRPVLMLVGVLFLNLLPRVSLAPLLLSIEDSLALSRTQSGGLFLFVSFGFSGGMLVSGFIAERLHHRRTILLSLIIVGSSSILLALSRDMRLVRAAFVLIGTGAGFYVPSGIATLTAAVHARHWGKAIALHEVGPTMGYFSAPLIAEVAIRFIGWRWLYALIGLSCYGMAYTYRRFAPSGSFPGAAPNLRHLRSILAHRDFWVVAGLFVLGLGSEMGVYAMLPTFLIEARGMTVTGANTLVAISRLSALVFLFGSGFLADRFGARRLMTYILLGAGGATLGIGILRGVPLAAAVLLQPMLVAAFFPAGFAMLSGVATRETRNLAVSLVIPIGYLFGAGAGPVAIGALSELGMFGAGFVIFGAMMMGSVMLLRFLHQP